MKGEEKWTADFIERREEAGADRGQSQPMARAPARLSRYRSRPRLRWSLDDPLMTTMKMLDEPLRDSRKQIQVHCNCDRAPSSHTLCRAAAPRRLLILPFRLDIPLTATH